MTFQREPLLHFLVLGAGLFLLFRFVGGTDELRTDRIVVTTGQIEQLIEGWTRTWQRPQTRSCVDACSRNSSSSRDLMASVKPSDEQLDALPTEHSETVRIPPSSVPAIGTCRPICSSAVAP